jgi:adenylate kinase
MPLNVIMMGPPGAGKGTQAAGFARDRGLITISTGDILREAIKTETPLGVRAKATMDRGELVDDETMIGIVRERLARPDARSGFVLDGFPRTVLQAHALDQMMEEQGWGRLIVVDIVVPLQELVRRLVSRRICANCGENAPTFEGAPTGDTCGKCGGLLVQRSDDNQEVVLERLRVYDRQTYPLVEYYRARPTFRVVNGDQSPERVGRELATVIDDAAVVGASIASQGSAS